MNQYEMAANCPTSFYDVLGLYARDFHFYVIYYIARARCYSKDEAYRLAGFSQYVDQNPQTDAISIWSRLTSPFVYTGTDKTTISRMRTLTERNAYLHFPGSTVETGAVIEGGGTVERLKYSMAKLDFNSEKSLAVAGAALHSYADTWGHQGYSAWPSSKVNARPGALGFLGGVASFYIGHGSGLSEPDTPYKNPTAATLAAKRIFEEIPDRCSNPCSDWNAAKKDLIQMFNLKENDVGEREKFMRKIINSRFGDHVLYNERDFYINSSTYLNYLGLPDTYDWRE